MVGAVAVWCALLAGPSSSAAEAATGSIEFGKPTAVETTAYGERVELAFDGVAGERVALTIGAITYTAGTSRTSVAWIERPDGSVLSGYRRSYLPDSGFFIDTADLDVSGVYKVIFEPRFDATAKTTLTLHDVPPDVTDTITPEGVTVEEGYVAANGAIGQNVRLRFEGTAGQRVALDISDGAYLAGTFSKHAKFWIERPDGQRLSGSRFSAVNKDWFIDPAELPVSGTYTVVFDPYFDTLAVADLRLYDVPPDVGGTTSIGASPEKSTTTTPGQNVKFTFQGRQGQGASLRVGKITYASGDIRASKAAIRDPSGKVITRYAYSYLPSSGYLFPPVTLPADGTYTVTFDPNFDSVVRDVALDVGYGPGLAVASTFGSCGGGMHLMNPSSCQSDPINAATGGFLDHAVDLRLGGSALPFALARTYNSLDATVGPLGRGWTHSYATALTVDDRGDVVLRAEDGQQVVFTKQPDGSFITAPGGRSKLRVIEAGYELIRTDQVRYRFDAEGRLMSVRDRNGQGPSLAYGADGRLTTVTDTAGREIGLDHDAEGRLVTVRLPDGRRVTYAYADGLLGAVTDAAGQTTRYGYDSSGRLISKTDANSHRAYLNTYSPAGRVVEQIDAVGQKTTFAWDAATQTQTATDARGNAWQDVFERNMLMRRVDPLGNVTRYGYDAELNRTSETSARGHVTSMTYDQRGNLLSRTAPAPLAYRETFTYDAQNNLLSATDGRGNATSFGYDDAGNLVATTQPGARVTRLERDPDGTGLVKSATDPLGRTARFDHDAQGNLTGVTSPLGAMQTMGYDQVGRQVWSVDPRGNAGQGTREEDFRSTYVYDGADRLVSMSDPLGAVTSFGFDAVGNSTSVKDANGHVTVYGYDPTNRLVSVTAPDGTRTAYDHDEVGNVVARTDANGHATNYVYDRANRLANMTTPGGGRWDYDHDANGNLARVVDANAGATADPGDGTTSYRYDEIDRLVSVDYSDATPDVSFGYDANSNRTAMTDGAGTQSYRYDDLDRLTGLTRGGDTFAYRYDDADQLVERTYPSGRATTYGYDADGQLADATSAGQGVTYAYDQAGALTEMSLPNGLFERRSYDRAGRLVEQEVDGDRNKRECGSVCATTTYAYDPVGNPTSVATPQGPVVYRYDRRDQLTEACYAESCADATGYLRYRYDPVGNRLAETRPEGTTTYSFDADDRLMSKTGPEGTVSYEHDRNGNQTRAGERAFSYDLANRLSSATQDGATITYRYDGDGNRRSASSGTADAQSTEYVWDVNAALPQLAQQRDGAGASTRSFVYGHDLISMASGDRSSFFHHDALGSVANVTAADGSPQWSYSYEPYGQARTNTKEAPDAPENPIRFAGELYEPELGQYHLRARQYDPADGRFTATDPLAPAATDPYLSTYHYAKNRPTTLIDPSGMGAIWADQDSCDVWCALIGDPLSNPFDFATLFPTPLKFARLGKVAGAATKGRTTLYRAVGPNELADIQSLGRYRVPAGGTEGKYFFNTRRQASNFARMMGDKPYTTTGVRVSRRRLARGQAIHPAREGPGFFFEAPHVPSGPVRIFNHSVLP